MAGPVSEFGVGFRHAGVVEIGAGAPTLACGRTALLGKQFRVQPAGWREATGAYGEVGSYRSVTDAIDTDSLIKVRSFKKEQKASAKAPH